MREVPISAFLPRLRTQVNVPLVPLMESAVVEAAITFCRESQVVLTSYDVDRIYANQTLSVIGRSGINQCTQGRYKSAGVLAITSQQDSLPLKVGRDYQALSLDNIRLLAEVVNVTVHAAIEPQKTTTYLPAVLLEDWELGICAGAACQLLKQPDRDWSHSSLSIEQGRTFVEQWRQAKRWRLEQIDESTRPTMARNRVFY